MILVIAQIDELQENELSLVHLADMDEKDGVASIVELIHKMALGEFLSRSLESLWDWEIRTKNMFINNHLWSINDVSMLPDKKVNRLVGCGYITRKEVYDVFCQYHLRLKFWDPEKHYSKINYRF